MKWISIVIILYTCYYTLLYARIVWKQGNKFAGMAIALLAISVITIPLLSVYLKNYHN